MINRRGMLKLLSLAPVAAPIVAFAAAHTEPSHELVVGTLQSFDDDGLLERIRAEMADRMHEAIVRYHRHQQIERDLLHPYQRG